MRLSPRMSAFAGNGRPNPTIINADLSYPTPDRFFQLPTSPSFFNGPTMSPNMGPLAPLFTDWQFGQQNDFRTTTDEFQNTVPQLQDTNSQFQTTAPQLQNSAPQFQDTFQDVPRVQNTVEGLGSDYDLSVSDFSGISAKDFGDVNTHNGDFIGLDPIDGGLPYEYFTPDLSDDVDGEHDTDEEYLPQTPTAVESVADDDYNHDPASPLLVSTPAQVNGKQPTKLVTLKLGTNEKDTKNTRNSKTSQEAVIEVNDVLSLPEKMKKASQIITAQKKKADPAKKMGSNVNIVESANGVSVTGVFWNAPSNDPSIPSTHTEITECIDELVAAMRNYENCREKDTTRQFLNRWAPGATHYSHHEMKAAAHEVLDTILAIHRDGWTKYILDKDQRELFQKTMFFTFDERFNSVIELLTYSKTTCQDLMKGERLYAIVGNPYILTTRTASNMKSNKNKAWRIAVGTEAEKEQIQVKKRARDDDDENNQELAVDARRIKRACTKRTPY